RLGSKGRLKRLCGSLEGGIECRWHSDCGLHGSDGIHSRAKRSPGCQVEGEGHSRELALMTDGEITRRSRIQPDECAQRDHLTCDWRSEVKVFESFGAHLQFRRDLENDAILVRLCKVLRDLSLSESVVQRIVDQLRLNTKARCCVAINCHNDSRGIRLL